MKLTTVTNVSVDGVMQGLGGPDEDPSGGFERGGWALPLFDDEAGVFLGQVYQRADAFLFGRRTYDIFAGYWRLIEDPDNPIASALNCGPSTWRRPRSPSRSGRTPPCSPGMSRLRSAS